MPEPLLRIGPWGLAYWQWIGSAAALVIAVIVGRIVARLVIWLASRITARTASTWDDVALARLARPLRFVGCVIAGRLLLPALELPGPTAAATKDVLLAAFGLGVVWGVVRLVDVVVSH